MYEITDSLENKDLIKGMDIYESRDYYLSLQGSFKSKLPAPTVYPSPERSDIFILDFAKGPCGLKAYAAEKFISELDPNKTLGYAAPRVGHAAEAIAMLAETYGKRAVFFAASSKQVTAHQAVVQCYKGCELRFARIPAMPTLNSWIRGWADKFNGIALPFGLANTPEVTAGIINLCEDYSVLYGDPPEFYCSVSTGTMLRAMQIGWPDSNPVGVAVSRNIKDTEKGRAEVTSYHKTFYQSSEYMPEFNTTTTYDAKAYKIFIENAKPGSIFINVGSDKQIEDRLVSFEGWEDIDSVREWGDQEAFENA